MMIFGLTYISVGEHRILKILVSTPQNYPIVVGETTRILKIPYSQGEIKRKTKYNHLKLLQFLFERPVFI